MRAGAGMWRHAERLPVSAGGPLVSLGEGGTPLLPLSQRLRERLGVGELAAKAEHLNPTGSFKDRVAAVAVTLAVQRGQRGCVGTSSGNGAAALAAYAARGGCTATIFARSDITPAKLAQVRAFGARVFLVERGRDDGAATADKADRVAALAREHDLVPFLTGFRYSPEAMCGVKTIALELLEQAPEATVVYVPIGGGGLLTGIGRGYAEGAGPGRSPRLVAVQPQGCATLARALAGEPPLLPTSVSTTISGLQVPALFDPDGAVEAVRSSGGHVTEVSDEDILEAQRWLAREEGLWVEPAGAAALAGVRADSRAGLLDAGERVVVLLTGAGYKDARAAERLASGVEAPVITVEEMEVALLAGEGAGREVLWDAGRP